NLPNPVFKKVAQDGSTNFPEPNHDWAGEIALDVEWAHAIAPGANILLVEAKNEQISNLMAAVHFATSQPGVSVVSMSFGWAERAGDLIRNDDFVTRFGHRGISFVASAGDHGDVNYPATSPNVLAVGGTRLTVDPLGNTLRETAWSTETAPDGSKWSTGGGIST